MRRRVVERGIGSCSPEPMHHAPPMSSAAHTERRRWLRRIARSKSGEVAHSTQPVEPPEDVPASGRGGGGGAEEDDDGSDGADEVVRGGDKGGGGDALVDDNGGGGDALVDADNGGGGDALVAGGVADKTVAGLQVEHEAQDAHPSKVRRGATGATKVAIFMLGLFCDTELRRVTREFD